MILNVGCGDDHHDDALNIDIRPTACPDLVAPADSIPYPDGCVEEIRAYDILEHTPEPSAFLLEWRRLLRPGGTLKVRVPNLEAIGAVLADRSVPLHHARLLIRNVYGGHRWDDSSDVHHWGWTPATLADDLHTMGFRVVANDEALNMTVEAEREP